MEQETTTVIDGKVMVCKPHDDGLGSGEKNVEDLPKKMCPPDPRFQQQNKTKWCYSMFIDFHRCAHYFSPDHSHCKLFQECYEVICPKAWIEKWEGLIDKGNFPRDLTKEMGC